MNKIDTAENEIKRLEKETEEGASKKNQDTRNFDELQIIDQVSLFGTKQEL